MAVHKNDEIRNLVTEVVLPSEGTGEEPEATDDEAAVTPEAQGDESAESTDEVAAETSEAPEGTDEDANTEYYGVDLSGLSAEERASIIAGFQERDKFIQQLLRNKPEGEAEAEATPPDPGDEEVSDDDLLKALGLDDPDDPYVEHSAKVALPLAKLVLDLQDRVQDLSNRAELDATERYWNQSLDGLEAQYGKLPASHEEVMKQAASAGVGDPTDAYWRIMGPAKQQVMAEVDKRRATFEKTLKQGAKGTVRPASQTDASEKIIDAKDAKDAVRMAFAQLSKERGLDLPEFGDE